MQSTEAGYEVEGSAVAALATSISKETEVVSEKMGVKPLGVGMVVMPVVRVVVA